jgi:uncharacterized membrane protein YkoI
MHALPTLSLKFLLPSVLMAALLAAPCAFAKKDLFATEPGANQAPSAEQLAPVSSANNKTLSKPAKPNDAPTDFPPTPNADTEQETPEFQKESSLHKEPAVKAASEIKEPFATKESSTVKEASTAKESSATNEPSVIEAQLARLKRNLTKTKNDLFGSKESSEKRAAAANTEPQVAETAPVEEDQKPELHIISATEAAQRAQTFTEGQVINVRLYQESGLEESKPRYAVKLLQKNGRMKTINLDAVNGTLIEETPQ